MFQQTKTVDYTDLILIATKLLSRASLHAMKSTKTGCGKAHKTHENLADLLKDYDVCFENICPSLEPDHESCVEQFIKGQ